MFFGANFSFYVSLTRNYLDFQQIFMLQVLSAAVDRKAHILGGCTACEYQVRFGSDVVQLRSGQAGRAGTGGNA